MANVGTVEALLKLNDEFTGVLGKAVQQMDDAGKKIQKLGSNISATGKELTTSITLPLAAIGTAATVAFGSFDQAMTESTAIMGNLSEGMRTDLEDTAREVALTVKASATDVAESYYFLASAGLDASSSMQALPVVAEFAQAGMFNMARATDILTDAQSALGLTIKDDAVKNTENLIRVSDVLVKANTIANASVEQFGISLTSKAGTAMKQLGIEIESGVAVLAAWADQGVKAELAGERFNIVTRDMQTAAIKNKKAFEQFGIQVFDTSGKFRNMADIIEDMEGALGGMSDEQKKSTLMMLGFSDRSVQATQSLLGLSKNIRGYEEDLRRAGGTTHEVSQKQLQSLWSQLGLLKDRFIDAAITLGASLQPAFEIILDLGFRLADGLRDLAKWFSDLPSGVKLAAVAIAGIAAAAGPLLVIVGGLITAWGAVSAALAGILPVLTAVGGAFVSAAGILLSWPVVLGAIALAIEPVRNFLFDLGKKILSAVKIAVTDIIATFKDWWQSTEKVRSFLGALVKVIRDDVIEWVSNVVKSIKEFISETGIMETAIDAIKLAFNFWVKGLKDTYEWIGDLFVQVVDFVGGMDGLLEIFKLVNPSMAGAVAQLQEWVEKAKAGMVAGDNLTVTTDEMDRAFAKLANQMPELDKEFESLTASTEQADKKLTKFTRSAEELKSIMQEGRDTVAGLKEKIDSLRSVSEVDIRFDAIFTEDMEAALLVIQGEQIVPITVAFDLYNNIPPPPPGVIKSFTDQIKSEFTSLATSIISDSGLIKSAIKEIFGTSISDSIGGFVDAFSAGFSQAAQTGEGFIDSLKAGWQSFKETYSGTLNGIVSGFQATSGQSKDMMNAGLTAIANFATGNYVGAFIAVAGIVVGLFSDQKRSIEEVRDSFNNYVSDIVSGKNTIEAASGILTDFWELASRDAAAAALEIENSFGDLVDAALEDILALGTSLESYWDSVREITAIGEIISTSLREGVTIGQELEYQLDKVKNKFYEVMVSMKEFMTAQSEDIVAGLISVFGDFSTMTAKEFEFAKTSILQAFNTMLDAGVPFAELIQRFAPLFEQIGIRAAELGIEIPEEFARVGEVFNILADEGLQKVLNRLIGIGEVAVAAGNLGILTAEQFDYLGDKARQAYNKLIAGGLEGNEALVALAPTLQQILDLQEMYGYEVDESTQALLDQAEAQGLISKKGLDTNDILIKGFERMLEALNRLIAAMGGVPIAFEGWIASAEEMGDRTRRTFREVAEDATNTGTAIDDAIGGRGGSGSGTGSSGGGSTGGGTAGGGGVARGGGYQHGTGGFLDFGKESFVALHGKEEVINFDQGKSIAEMVHMAIRGAGSGNGYSGIDSTDSEMLQLLSMQNSILSSIATSLEGESKFKSSMETRGRVQR